MNILDRIAPIGHWFLRLALASVFLYHGIGKFGQFEALASMMNMPVAVIVMIALAEIIGSLLILIGGVSKDWMTRLGALMLIPVMLGAIFMVHWGQWSFMATESHPAGGIEFQFTLLMIQLYLFVKGNRVKVSRQAGG